MAENEILKQLKLSIGRLLWHLVLGGDVDWAKTNFGAGGRTGNLALHLLLTGVNGSVI